MSETALTIRHATAEDEATLAALMLETNRHYYGENSHAEAMTQEAAKLVFSGGSSVRVILGFAGDRPVAYSTVALLHPSSTSNGTLFMKELFVSPTVRSAGYGAQMMRFVAAYAESLGCPRFDWTAETDNPRAVAFYDRLGVTRVTEKVYFRFAGDDLSAFAKG